MCCTAIQETHIPSEKCVEKTCITDGKHVSLVIYVRGNTHPWETYHYDTADSKISTANGKRFPRKRISIKHCRLSKLCSIATDCVII